MADISIINGRVYINGREVTGDPQASAESNPADSKPATKTHVAAATELVLDVTTAAVTVTSNGEPGIRVEVEGPKKFVDNVTFREDGQSLSVREKSPSGSFSGTIITNSSVVISGSSYSFGSSSHNDECGRIRIIVPEGTAITAIGAGTSDIGLNIQPARLQIRLSGQAELAASGCEGRVSARLSGQTSAVIECGTLQALDVTVSGQSELRFGGETAEADVTASGQSEVLLIGTVGQAALSASGQSEITARRVTKLISKRCSGQASIRT